MKKNKNTQQYKEYKVNYGQQRVQEIMKALAAEGLAEKYEHAGIYSISINSTLVYIGKSVNMLERVAQHLFEIYKNNTIVKKI